MGPWEKLQNCETHQARIVRVGSSLIHPKKCALIKPYCFLATNLVLQNYFTRGVATCDHFNKYAHGSNGFKTFIQNNIFAFL